MAKYSVEQVRAAWEAAGRDFAKTQASTGISRANLFRYLALIRGQNGAAAAPAPVAPVVVPADIPAAAFVPDASQSLTVAALPALSPVPVPPVAAQGGAAVKRGGDGRVDPGLAPEGPLDLTPYVPPADGEILGYKPRKRYFEALQSFYSAAITPLLVGEAGVGKTILARFLAYTLKLPYLEISCDALLGFQELFGQVNITDGTSIFIEGLFLKFFEQPCVILLDEVNALDAAKNFKLHQLLNSRETFVKEADRGRGKLYRGHPKCFIILAGNPPTGKYNGVNRFNVALVNRVQVLDVEELNKEEVEAIVPAHAEKEKLVRYYEEARGIIRAQSLRTTFSIRNLKAIIGDLSLGFTVKEALLYGFLNQVKYTAGEDAFGALYKLALAIWPLDGEEPKA